MCSSDLADLLLHVMDAASPQMAEQQAEVERVLEEIGASGVPQLLVCNKADCLDEHQRPRERSDWIEVGAGIRRQRIFVSALTGDGLPELRQAIAAFVLERLNAEAPPPTFTLPDGRVIAN